MVGSLRNRQATKIAAAIRANNTTVIGPRKCISCAATSARVAFNPIARDAHLDPAEVAWRGNAMSPLTHWVAHLALVAARRSADARAARTQLEELIELSGCREFYDATTREGYGAGARLGYAGAALVLEMAAREDAP